MTAAVYTTPLRVYAYLRTPPVNQTPDETAQLTSMCADAAAVWERLTATTFGAETALDAVFGPGGVIWDADGTVWMRVRTAPIRTVTAVALRWGDPTHAWTTLADLTRVILWDRADPRGATRLALYPGYGPNRGPIWVRLSYTAGAAGTTDDPYPAEVIDWNTRYAAYLFRHRDAPYEKVADLATGIVRVPVAMPKDLERIACEWGRWNV